MSDGSMNELARLEQLYGGMGDGELLLLAKDPASLTEAGQTALAAEMRARGLAAPASAAAADEPASGVAVRDEAGPGETAPDGERAEGFGMGVPGIVPGAGPAVEQALEPVGATRAGMAQLWGSYDGIELSTACAALEAAAISPAVEEVTGDPTEGRPNFFRVWVNAGEVEAAKTVLRTKLGLFPELEPGQRVDEGDEEFPGEEDRVVAEFDSAAEAEAMRETLIEAGIAAGVQRSNLDDAMSAVTVAPGQYEAALALLSERLGLEE